MELIVSFALLGGLIVAYFVPSIIANHRHTSNRWAVLVLNIFFGWTLIGWVVCLAMSVSGANVERQATTWRP